MSAPELQALATIALVILTAVYVRKIGEQTEASQETVDRLVERDQRRELHNLRLLRSAMTSLGMEAQRWDEDVDDILGLARRGALPEDHFQPANLPSIQEGASAIGGGLQETVWRALDSAREARRELDVLRGWGNYAKGQSAADRVTSLGRALSDVQELALKAAASAQEEIEKLEQELDS